MRKIIKDLIDNKIHISEVVKYKVKRRRKTRKIRKLEVNSVFYVIKVFPRDSLRYKFGYTQDIFARVRQFQTLAPDYELIRRYPCHPNNELVLLEIIANLKGVAMIGEEVADIIDSKTLIEYLDLIFASNDMLIPVTDKNIIFNNVVNYRCKIESKPA